MKGIKLEELDALVKAKRVVAYEQRKVFNTVFKADWIMTGMVFEDGSFVGVYSEGGDESYLLFENGK